VSNFRNSSKKASKVTRRVNSLPLRTRILIVCEGMKTEPNYFRSFRVNARIEIEPASGNTLSLVRRAEELAEGDTFDQIWCVFDRDSFPPGNFNNAIFAARAKGFRVAYTNEAFELWYMLHFNYHTSALSRTQYEPILTRNLGRKYRKNDSTMYTTLKSMQQAAITNAEGLISYYGVKHNPEVDNPSTTVHELVIELNKFLIP